MKFTIEVRANYILSYSFYQNIEANSVEQAIEIVKEKYMYLFNQEQESGLIPRDKSLEFKSFKLTVEVLVLY